MTTTWSLQGAEIVYDLETDAYNDLVKRIARDGT
jgi:hypothetical protein